LTISPAATLASTLVDMADIDQALSALEDGRRPTIQIRERDGRWFYRLVVGRHVVREGAASGHMRTAIRLALCAREDYVAAGLDTAWDAATVADIAAVVGTP
jgi:hypothetical protein